MASSSSGCRYLDEGRYPAMLGSTGRASSDAAALRSATGDRPRVQMMETDRRDSRSEYRTRQGYLRQPDPSSTRQRYQIPEPVPSRKTISTTVGRLWNESYPP